MSGKIAVVGLLRAPTGEVCAISRKDNFNDLGLPGGKLEHGETHEEGLRRELKEELGIEVIRTHPVFVAKDVNDTLVFVFEIDEYRGRPTSQHFEGRVIYVPPKRLVEESNTFHKFNQELFEHMSIPTY